VNPEEKRIRTEVMDATSELRAGIEFLSSEEGVSEAVEKCSGFNKPGNAKRWVFRNHISEMLHQLHNDDRSVDLRQFIADTVLHFAIECGTDSAEYEALKPFFMWMFLRDEPRL
jgi:hypothetical protein